MKLLTPLFILFISFSLFAQEGTTLEEYRYLSKGYLYQKELGLDIYKNGYTVKNIFITSKNAQLIGLYKDGEKDTKALLVVIEEQGQAPIYVCIPNKNSEERVLSLYNLDIQRLINVETRKMYDNAMQEFLYSALNNNTMDMQELSSYPQSYDHLSKSTEPIDMQNQPEEDILVSKGGVESVVLTESEPVKEAPVKESKPKPVITQAISTISGDVRSRDVIVAPNVQTESLVKGTVAVKVCVDMDGYVSSAKFTQRGSTTLDKDLKKISVDAASRYRFGKSDRKEECGIITFEF